MYVKSNKCNWCQQNATLQDGHDIWMILFVECNKYDWCQWDATVQWKYPYIQLGMGKMHV